MSQYADLIGAKLGQYEVVDLIGQGGMAAVYRGYQRSLDRFVAIKVLPGGLARDAALLERFRREARAIAQLEHPHILPIYDFGEQGGMPYIVMALVHGGTLLDRLGAPLPLEWAVQVTAQIGGALDYAHRRGVVHRDVEPANVLLGAEEWPLLADFGIAWLTGAAEKLTRTGVAIGTPEYLSPEQAQELPIDGRADQYALAIMLFEMLARRLPFTGASAIGVILKQIGEPPPSARSINPRVSAAVDRVLARALSKDPAHRYATMADFTQALLEASSPELLTRHAAIDPIAGPNSLDHATAPVCDPDNRTELLGGVGLAGGRHEPATQRAKKLIGGMLAAAIGIAAIAGAALALSMGPFTLPGTESDAASAPIPIIDSSSATPVATEVSDSQASSVAPGALATPSDVATPAPTSLAVASATPLPSTPTPTPTSVPTPSRSETSPVPAQPTAVALKLLPTPIRAPATAPARGLSAFPTPSVVPRLTVDLTEANCQLIAGTVSLPGGAEKPDAYVLSVMLIEPNGQQRLIANGLERNESSFRVQYPLRLIGGGYEVQVDATRPGVYLPGIARAPIAC